MTSDQTKLNNIVDAGIHIGLIKKSRRRRVLAIAKRGGAEYDLVSGLITDRIKQLVSEYNGLEERGLLVHYSYHYPQYFQLLYKARYMKRGYSQYLHLCLKIESERICQTDSMQELQKYIHLN